MDGRKRNSGSFKNGNIPWNKGMKGYGAKWLNNHVFPPGYKPHNWKPVGSTRLDKNGYILIKVAEGANQYRLRHREEWKQHHGSYPPKGSQLIFIDGNKQNCDISNLKLITRKELIAMNTAQRFPENLKEVIRLKGVLRRKINGK